MPGATDTHYDVLGVSPDASAEEIKAAYREKVKEHHPDHSDDPNAGEKLIRVREAKETLLDADARKRYDRKRDTNASDSTDDTTSTTEQRTRHGQNRTRERNRKNQRNRTRERNRREQKDRRNKQNRRNRRNTRHERHQQTQYRNQHHTETERTRSQTRTSRETETRSRERNRTDSRERRAHAEQGTWKQQLLDVIDWARMARNWPRQWRRTHFRSDQAVLELLHSIATAPTVIRLAATVLLAFSAIRAIRAIGGIVITPSTEFGVLLVALTVSYVGYAVFSPLPFESSRTRERFKPAGKETLWPIILLHFSGIGFFGLTAVLGTSSGIAYAGGAVVYVMGMTVVCSVVVCFLRTIARGQIRWLFIRPGRDYWLRYQKDEFRRGVYWGVRLGPVIAALLLFTSFGEGSSLRSIAISNTGSSGPWIPILSIGPIHLGSVLNFLVATIAFVSVIGGVVGMIWALTRVPWRDRYDHGYSIRPVAWNLAVAAPTVCFVWMLLSGVEAVGHTVRLTQGAVAGVLFFLPTPLLGVYLLRRRIEPTLREYR